MSLLHCRRVSRPASMCNSEPCGARQKRCATLRKTKSSISVAPASCVCSRCHPHSYERSIGQCACVHLRVTLRTPLHFLVLPATSWGGRTTVFAFSVRRWWWRRREGATRPGYTQDKTTPTASLSSPHPPLSNNSPALAFWGSGG